MQVYRGLDIGTAKPTPGRAGRDPAPPDRRRRSGRGLVGGALPARRPRRGRRHRVPRQPGPARGRHRPLRAGGDRPADLPARGPRGAGRARGRGGEPRGAGRGLPPSCKQVDAVAAARIEPGNRRRIVRALEVIRITGRPVLLVRRRAPGVRARPRSRSRLAGVWLPRAALADAHRPPVRRPCATPAWSTRCAVSWPRGTLVADRPPGHRLQGGRSRTSRATTTHAVAERRRRSTTRSTPPSARTRSFARRQRMWFRRDPRITWFAAGDESRARSLPALLAHWDK